MQSGATTAVASSSADAKAGSAKAAGSAAAKKAAQVSMSTSTFNSKEAERWMDARWKALQTSTDPNSNQKVEVYKAAPGTGGSAWGPNKKTVNDRFCNDLSKAATAAGL